MKNYLALFIVVFLSVFTHAQNRQTDISFTLNTDPDTIRLQAEQYEILTYTIKNLGPDDLQFGDRYHLDIKIGHRLLFAIYKPFNLYMRPGDSITHSHEYKVPNGIKEMDSLPICYGIQRVFSIGNPDTLKFEDPAWLGNNKECHEVPYKAAETNSINSQISEVNTPLYPNPTTDLVTITTTGKADVEVHNILGTKVAIYAIEGKTTLRLGNLKSGTYLVTISQGESIQRYKLIKQ